MTSLATGRASQIFLGQAGTARLKRAARHLGNMALVCEDALPENRITLSDKVDSDGIPYAHTHHDLAPRAATRWTQRMAEGEEIMRAAGARRYGPDHASECISWVVLSWATIRHSLSPTGMVVSTRQTTFMWRDPPSFQQQRRQPHFYPERIASHQAEHLLVTS